MFGHLTQFSQLIPAELEKKNSKLKKKQVLTPKGQILCICFSFVPSTKIKGDDQSPQMQFSLQQRSVCYL